MTLPMRASGRARIHRGQALAALAAASTLVLTTAVDAGPGGAQNAEAVADFVEVSKVLLSPRCRNCHPRGDAPLQGEVGRVHSMNVSRKSAEAGLACTTCHRRENHPVVGGPPGAPDWHMPSEQTPMVFEGRSAAELCAQLKTTAKTGGRDLPALVDHLEHDPFVLWAWAPGKGRTAPPISHADLVIHAKRWIAGGAPCPQ